MSGNFFEDFAPGRFFRHATPRTITEGDCSLYVALTGSRQPLYSSVPLAKHLGFSKRPVEDLLVFHIAFGKTVSDISANAIANLGYADVRFIQPVFVGDTLTTYSEVIGLRETSNGKSGIVYVQSKCVNQHESLVLTWIRWVLIPKINPELATGHDFCPNLPTHVHVDNLAAPRFIVDIEAIKNATATTRFWEDYTPTQRVIHPMGMTINDSDHSLATRLYQNNAAVHFDALAMAGSPRGQRLVYGGHVISICSALSYDGFENALGILAINSGTHSAPVYAGDTLYCFNDVVEQIELPGLDDLGALRLRLTGLKNVAPRDFLANPKRTEGDTTAEIVLDLDYIVMMPRRGSECLKLSNKPFES